MPGTDIVRSRFGPGITTEAYAEEFFSEVDGAAKVAVKRMTGVIEAGMRSLTINAPDW